MTNQQLKHLTDVGHLPVLRSQEQVRAIEQSPIRLLLPFGAGSMRFCNSSLLIGDHSLVDRFLALLLGFRFPCLRFSSLPVGLRQGLSVPRLHSCWLAGDCDLPELLLPWRGFVAGWK